MTILTGKAIDRASLLALKYSVKLECVGIRFTGGSRTAYAKRRFGLPMGWRKKKVLAWLEDYIAQFEVANHAAIVEGTQP